MKRAILVLTTTLFLGACAGTGGQKAAAPATEESANQAIAAAEMTTQQAGKAGFEWRDTGKMLDQAKEAAAKKEYAQALKLANKAKRQSENALLQAAAASK